MVESNRELRARLLEESARKAREALMRGSAPRSYLPDLPAPAVSDAALAAMQAEAAARARAKDPPERAARQIARVLPPQVQAAAGIRVENPRVWEADLTEVKKSRQRPDTNAFQANVRKAAAGRAKGDPMAVTIYQVAGKLVFFLAKSTTDFVRVTFETLAKTSEVCVETARKVVRFLEARGLLDTFNVVYRTTEGDERRAANLYFLRGEASSQPEPSPAGMLDRVTDRLRRYAATFGLKARRWGFNATPLRNLAPAAPVQDTG